MGIKFLIKYRHNRYQVYRTISVMFFQLSFAYLIPAFLVAMNQPEEYFSYFWPLDSYALRPEWTLNWKHPNTVGDIGYIIIGLGFIMQFIWLPSIFLMSSLIVGTFFWYSETPIPRRAPHGVTQCGAIRRRAARRTASLRCLARRGVAQRGGAHHHKPN